MALAMAAILGGLFGAGVVALTGSTLTRDTAVPYQSPLGAERVQPNQRLSAGQIYKDTAPGTVYIQVFSGARAGSGSGFIIDDEGNILTNQHVVDGAKTVDVIFQNQERAKGRVVGTAPSADLALIKVNPKRLKLNPLTLGNSDSLAVGDPVAAMGAPFGLDRTLTTGVVSALDRTITAPNGFPIQGAIQHDASINPGSSGGPLLDAGGRVIGINSQISTDTGSNAGIGFAVPVNTAKKLLPELKRGGVARQAWLGIEGTSVRDVPSEVGLDASSGAYIQQVTPGGPADEAGLRGGKKELETPRGVFRVGGDIITAINNKPTETFEDVVAAVGASDPGKRVRVRVLRNGKERDFAVELGAQPLDGVPGRNNPEEPDPESPFPPRERP